MYGLIGKLRAQADQREALVAILLEGIGDGMPGCLSYVVGNDPSDPDVLWVTEVWDNRESHHASLSLPAVKAAVEKARKIIGGFETSIPFTPVGGFGLDGKAPRAKPQE